MSSRRAARVQASRPSGLRPEGSAWDSQAVWPRSAGRLLLLTACAALLLFCAGCASVSRRVPPPSPAELENPAPWIERLRNVPRTRSVQAHLRLTIQAEGRRPVAIDGSLAALLPDTLLLKASLGPFKPIFAFWADADSCVLLLHDEARTWVVARRQADWEAMNPAALAGALGWVLDPPALAGALDPAGPARWEGGLVRIRGRLREAPEAAGALGRGPLDLELGLEPRSAGLRSLRVLRGNEELLTATLSRFRSVGRGEVPTSFILDLPTGGWGFQGELRGPRTARRVKLPGARDRRPPGWEPVGPSFVLTPGRMGSR